MKNVQKENIVQFNLQKIKCAGCVNKIETKLTQIKGVAEAKVDLLEKTLLVKYVKNNLDNKIITAVESLGFGITSEKIEEPKINLWFNVVLPMLVGIFMMTFGMTEQFMLSYESMSGFILGMFQSLLTLCIVVLTAKDIFKSGINGFRTLNFNMYSLIVLGVSAAWLYSTWIILIGYFLQYTEVSHLYFESAVIIISFINLGSYLEDKAKSNTTNAIKSLMQLQPNKTTIMKGDQEQIIDTNLLQAGSIIKIRPGELISADGIITYGDSYVNESMITGEPIAVHKKIGDKIIAGSINTNGVLLFEATNVGGNTLLADIINLVKSAQMSKPFLAKLADKVSKIFVPIVMLIAILSAIIWYYFGPEPHGFYAVSIFMTILIIACPCSVGLAVPVSLMVGLGKSATKGILIRDAKVLSYVDKLDYILLDKTGTITEGKPNVTEFTVNFANKKQEYLRIIKALENNSEHPLAHAIINYQSELQFDDITVENFTMIGGSGIEGTINGQTYYAGSKEWISKLTTNMDSNLFANNHSTQVFLANNHNILARIDITDLIKNDSISAIKSLQGKGIKVAMVTGDNESNANYIAKQIGLDTVYANCKPNDKINIVKNLQMQHYIVGFVGDGINDAPSLAQANIGIAIGSGADIAIQSASITLMHSSLANVNDAISIANAINRNMKQNLFGSFVYNSIAVIIAAGALYPICGVLLNPIIASIAMSLSSITVTLNAMRLRKM